MNCDSKLCQDCIDCCEAYEECAAGYVDMAGYEEEPPRFGFEVCDEPDGSEREGW